MRTTLDRVRSVMSTPGYVLTRSWQKVIRFDERFVARLMQVSQAEIRSTMKEVIDDPEVEAWFRSVAPILEKQRVNAADIHRKAMRLQYAMVRVAKPEVAVETGVFNGLSSYFLLLAMERNGTGTLHSIDFGDDSYLPEGRQRGWVVPDPLRHRWKLHIRDAKEFLPELLQQIQPIDLFNHDSDHSFEHMTFELNVAFESLRAGGLILADDATWNEAFPRFAAAHVPRSSSAVVAGIGILRKP